MYCHVGLPVVVGIRQGGDKYRYCRLDTPFGEITKDEKESRSWAVRSPTSISRLYGKAGLGG